jgi:hypothetical protein
LQTAHCFGSDGHCSTVYWQRNQALGLRPHIIEEFAHGHLRGFPDRLYPIVDLTLESACCVLQSERKDSDHPANLVAKETICEKILLNVSVQLAQGLVELAEGSLASGLADRAPFFPRENVGDVVVLGDEDALYGSNVRTDAVCALLV